MKRNKIFIICIGLISITACTKLNETLQSSLVAQVGSSGSNVQNLLNAAYNDIGAPFINQDEIFSLQENTSDESLVPTRGGDWNDNGVWRVLHAHTWDVTHAQSSTVFNNLGKMESDATTVLAFNPTAEQAAEAIFLRSMAQYFYLDLFGQVPYRTVPNYNTINAPPVMQPSDAIDTLVTNLTNIIPLLSSTQATAFPASANAARFLLMKVLLNKQAFLNRATPAAAAPADMAEVVALGNAIINSGLYTFNSNYFDIFGPNNGGSITGYGAIATENIFGYPNNGQPANNGINNIDINARWMMTLHYNSWDSASALGGNGGWNGFSTIADVYNAFDPADTRRGNVPYPTVTQLSGLKVGMLEGQQFDQYGNAIKDRKGNPLNFYASVATIETFADSLESAGIRVVKYPPDMANYNTGHQHNQPALFRYADVLLMVAEADLRNGDAGDALTLVNQLHAARGAAPLTTISLVNTGNLYDGTTMLSERQKELYWESWRREDLIRFGVFTGAWALKPADGVNTFLLFPIPATQIVGNPNLKQNPGY
jgi:starch-binding outer membrane protein, SusD/RagB family